MEAGSRRIAACLERIFELHPQVTPGTPLGRDSDLWLAFADLQRLVAPLPPVATRSNVQVKVSAGLGRKAKVPWLALLDRCETKSTQSGVYGALLFRPSPPRTMDREVPVGRAWFAVGDVRAQYRGLRGFVISKRGRQLAASASIPQVVAVLRGSARDSSGTLEHLRREEE